MHGITFQMLLNPLLVSLLLKAHYCITFTRHMYHISSCYIMLPLSIGDINFIEKKNLTQLQSFLLYCRSGKYGVAFPCS